jgi:hypothetical protein
MIIFAYALFLAGLATQNLRFLLLTFPLILVLFYPSFHFFYDRLVKARPITVYLAVFIVMTFQLALFYRAFRPFYENSRDTRYIAERMGNYPGKVIYTFNIDMALKAYHVNNQVVNLWAEKVGHFKPESLVLFNETGFSEQWKGYNPMINWETMKREYKLDLIEKMPGGWNLYEISE